MEHKHGVYDSDTRFSINPTTRQIKSDPKQKTTVIQHDHNSERFTFELPRIIEGHDMSTCNKVEVHYLNVDAKTKDEKKGVYVSDDLQISPEDPEKVVCSWLISSNATQLVGTLSFIVRFCCVEGSTVTYAWNTAVASVSVSTGINAGESVVAEYADILEKWKAELYNAGYINASTMQSEMNVLKQRMDTFSSLKEGSTTGDAELQDIRVGADDKVYDSAGSAVRIQVGKVTQFAVAESKRNKFLVDQSAVFINENGYFNISLSFVKAEHYQTAIFACELGDVFSVYNTQIGSSACRAALLDENKNVLDILEVGTGYIRDEYFTNEYVVMSKDAKYFAVTVYHEATNFKTQKYIDIADSLLAVEDAVFDVVEKPIEVNSCGNYYINVNGELIESQSYFCSDKINVVCGEKYHIRCSNLGIAAYSYALYKEDGSVLGVGVRGTGSTNDITEDYFVTIPDSAATIRFGWHSPENSIVVYKVETIRKDDNSKNPLYGKVLIGLGDSLMCDAYTGKGKEWLSLIAHRNNMTVYNYAVSGNPISVQDDCMAARYINMIDAEEPFVIVMGGANDLNISAPVGQNSDKTVATFKGALNVLVSGLIAKYPKGKIVFCTNYKRWGGEKEKAYADAMIEICALHSIPCHNNYTSSGCHFDNKGWMSIFGADASNFENKHLNADGDIRVSTMYENLLRSL